MDFRPLRATRLRAHPAQMEERDTRCQHRHNGKPEHGPLPTNIQNKTQAEKTGETKTNRDATTADQTRHRKGYH